MPLYTSASGSDKHIDEDAPCEDAQFHAFEFKCDPRRLVSHTGVKPDNRFARYGE